MAFAHKHQILLVHDLCYAELAFDGYQPTSLLEIPGGKEIGVEFHTTLAAMYLWVPCTRGMSSTDFALNVLQQTGVVVTPGNAFGPGGEGYVRISLIADCDRLGEALRRLKQANIRY